MEEVVCREAEEESLLSKRVDDIREGRRQVSRGGFSQESAWEGQCAANSWTTQNGTIGDSVDDIKEAWESRFENGEAECSFASQGVVFR
jgi:hypothetical protein